MHITSVVMCYSTIVHSNTMSFDLHFQRFTSGSSRDDVWLMRVYNSSCHCTNNRYMVIPVRVVIFPSGKLLELLKNGSSGQPRYLTARVWSREMSNHCLVDFYALISSADCTASQVDLTPHVGVHQSTINNALNEELVGLSLTISDTPEYSEAVRLPGGIEVEVWLRFVPCLRELTANVSTVNLTITRNQVQYPFNLPSGRYRVSIRRAVLTATIPQAAQYLDIKLGHFHRQQNQFSALLRLGEPGTDVKQLDLTEQFKNQFSALLRLGEPGTDVKQLDLTERFKNQELISNSDAFISDVEIDVITPERSIDNYPLIRFTDGDLLELELLVEHL